MTKKELLAINDWAYWVDLEEFARQIYNGRSSDYIQDSFSRMQRDFLGWLATRDTETLDKIAQAITEAYDL